MEAQEIREKQEQVRKALAHDTRAQHAFDQLMELIDIEEHEMWCCSECGWHGEAEDLIDEGWDRYCCPNCLGHSLKMEE